MSKSNQILNSVISECKRHMLRMNQAYEKITPSLPLTGESVVKLSDNEVEHIDQIIYRFSKLQDAIGHKLFKSILIALDEDVSDKSAIDVFNRLEQRTRIILRRTIN